MIELGMHTDNWRPLSGNFQTAADRSGLGQGATYVRNTLIKKLRTNKILLPVANAAKNPKTGRKKRELVSMEELGIRCPVLIDPKPVDTVQVPDPNAVVEDEPAGAGAAAQPKGVMGPAGAMEGEPRQKMITLRRFRFVVQFAWQPTPPSVREEIKKKAEEEKAQREANAQF